MNMRIPSFPPLMKGEAVTGAIDPFAKACALATLGCDAGTVVHNITADSLRAAIVFAPEDTLERSMAVLPTCGVGFQNALGALAPPEVSVHLHWSGGIEVNGARCGALRAAASSSEPSDVPDWIVVGLTVPLIPECPEAPGVHPNDTSLIEEGCADVDPVLLLEAWARHTLLWVARLEEGEASALHAEWRGLAKHIGEDVKMDLQDGDTVEGTFLGVDEHFGMLLRSGDMTTVIPLSACLSMGEAP